MVRTQLQTWKKRAWQSPIAVQEDMKSIETSHIKASDRVSTTRLGNLDWVNRWKYTHQTLMMSQEVMAWANLLRWLALNTVMKVKRVTEKVHRANLSQDAIALMTCLDHRLLTNFGRGWKTWDQVLGSTWGPLISAKLKPRTMQPSPTKLM